MAVNRQAILVLGMHRSGTSAVSGTLVRLGATAPAHLIPGDEHNAGGYWESAPLNRLHEDFLQALGTAWHGWTRLEPGWSDSSAARTFRIECSRLLREEFQDSTLFVVKDPRMCRLVQVLLRTLQEEGIQASAVLVLRNPMEVAQSLARRDGFSRERSLLVWLRNVLEAEHNTRLIRRSLVSYDDLTDDCRSVARQIAADLDIVWPLAPETLDADSCTPSDLRHFTLPFENANDAMVSRWVGEAWASFQCLLDPLDSGHELARARLDAVRTQFDDATTLFGRVADEERRVLVERGESERAHLRAALLERAESERAQLRTEIQTQRNNAQVAKAELEQVIERVSAERDEAVGRARDIQTELQVAHQTRDELRSQIARGLDDLRANQARLQEETTARYGLHQELVATQRRLEDLLNSVSWRATMPARRVVDALRRLVNADEGDTNA